MEILENQSAVRSRQSAKGNCRQSAANRQAVLNR